MPVDGDETDMEQSSIDADPALPRTPVVCKPFENAFEKVFKMAKIDPQRTVRSFTFYHQETIQLSY